MPPSDPRPSPPRIDPIAGSPVGDVFVYPPSFAQERLWFLDQLDPGASHYNFHVNTVLRGPLDVGALGRALEEIVARHEVLRTTFRVQNGRPAQVIAPPGRVPLPLTDLTVLPASDAKLEARRVATEEARGPFDLAEGPLLRARLLKREEGQHVLVLVFHHIVFDGWSMGVFFRELSELYEAFSSGRASGLPDLPIQYADYAVWQRDWLQGEVLEGQLAYWKAALAGAPLSLDLPTDRPRPPVQSFRGSSRSRALPESLRNGLVALSRREGATVFMTLLASFQVLLARHANQQDILVGSPVAGRNRLELEGLIGFFVNTLVMRGDLSGDPTFRQLLGRVREMALGAYAHQDLPFERLVEELQPERTLSHTPLFQVMFQMEEVRPPETNSSALRVEKFGVQIAISKFDLTCRMVDSGKQLSCSMEYAADLFESETVGRLLERFEVLLSGIVANPDERVSRLPLLTEAERHQLLVEWNGVDDRQGRREVSLPKLFERQVERMPEAVALVCGESQLSYAELNGRANRLAHHLMSLGVGAEVCVGLYLERSVEMVVAVIGVLKAGGAYVPLDLAYPAERVAFMLEEAEAPLLITQASLADRLPTSLSTQVLRLDVDADLIDANPSANPVDRAVADNAAYVIYTSGSTGKPKGVVVSHGEVARLFTETEGWFGFGEWDVWTLFHSYAFDFSVWELWGALLYGGRLVIVPYWVSRSPEAFLDLLVEEKVTVLNQTPSAFRQLSSVESQREMRPLALRAVIFGGEALELQSLKPWVERHGEETPRLVNMYGITETTVHVTYRPLTRADIEGLTGSVIGRPIPDMPVYLLDGQLQPVPIGVPGEMYVGGGGLARGYLRRPELTAERFVPNPFGVRMGGRLYRSGDLARYRAYGELEYLGRLDHQVKIRGYRIELGEIEAVLRMHPAVDDAVVVASPEDPGSQRLIAYVVGAPAGPEELRQFLSARLPDYMIPSVFLSLEHLPLTSSGKVDRKALPAPDRSRPKLEQAPVEPSTPVEEALLEIWREVLGTREIGVLDNFFALGGHSLLAVQVVSRARETLKVDLPLRALFETPTVRGLSRALEETRGAPVTASSAIPAVSRDAIRKHAAGREPAAVSPQESMNRGPVSGS